MSLEIFILCLLCTILMATVVVGIAKSKYEAWTPYVLIVMIFGTVLYLAAMSVWIGDIPDEISRVEWQRVEHKWVLCRADPVCTAFVQNYK